MPHLVPVMLDAVLPMRANDAGNIAVETKMCETGFIMSRHRDSAGSFCIVLWHHEISESKDV